MTSTLSRLDELKAAMEAKRAELKEGLDKGVRIDGSNVEVKSDDFQKLKTLQADIEDIKTLAVMEGLTDEQKDAFNAAGLITPEQKSAALANYANAFGGDPAPVMQAKSLGEMFTKSDLFQEFKKSGSSTMPQSWEIEAKDVAAMGTYGFEQKDVYTGLLTGAVNPRGFGSVQFDPAVPRGQRATRVRSLFPVAGTSANLIDYFRVLGFVEGADNRGNAKTVADRTKADGTAGNEVFGLKPKSNLKFEAAQAPVRTIAHWEAAHRNVLADEPQLQATINNELLYGLALVEDDQILNGDGTGENLLGILRTPNIQTYTQVSTDQKSDALRRAATLCVIANYPGTGYVLHPFDWEDIELQKASGDGQYMLVTNVAVGATTAVWRQPVVESPAMPEGTFLTGAFGIGAQLYDRQVANVRIAEQHSDFFVRNAVAILVEERLALAVKRPEAFVKGTFA